MKRSAKQTASASGPLAALERRVVEAVDEAALLDTLADLIAIPSVADRETPAQESMAAHMEASGLRTDVWEIDFDRLRRHPAYTADVERERGLGVVGTTAGDSQGLGRTLILNGHIDVVPAGETERWSRPPWRLTVEDGLAFGRGTVDMKGALCCALAAVRAVRDAGVELRGALQVQSVIGEEDGGAGTLAALERGHRGDGAIVLEPTRLAVAPAQAGALGFRIRVPGRAAHGAFREEGVDPVEKFIPIFAALRALEGERNASVTDPLFRDDALPFALAMGKLRSGIWASTVSEFLTVEGRYGVAPGEDLEAARGALEATVRQAASDDAWLRQHPARVEWVGAQFAPARTAVDDPVVTTLRDAHRDTTGSVPALRGMRYGADMRLLVNQGGIPTVLFGPGDVRQAHAADEFVPVSDLLAVARTLAVTAIRYCGVA